MRIEKLVKKWYKKWEKGDYTNLPITDDFVHTSPFGSIHGKEHYLKIIAANEDKFLNYKFVIEDKIFKKNKACIRYKAIQGDFELDVSEWHYAKKGLIKSIVSYYHIGEIKEGRKLKDNGH